MAILQESMKRLRFYWKLLVYQLATPCGPLTAFQNAAGFQSVGRGILNLTTGVHTAGPGINTTVAIISGVDAAVAGTVDVVTGTELFCDD